MLSQLCIQLLLSDYIMMGIINIFVTFLELKVMMNNSTTIWVGRYYKAIPVVHPTPSGRLHNDGSYQYFCQYFRIKRWDAQNGAMRVERYYKAIPD